MRRFIPIITVLALIPMTGCGLLDALFQSQSGNTVRLTNNGGYAVDVTLYYYDHDDSAKDVIETLGTKLEFTLAAGESTSFVRGCGVIESILIDKAKLRVVGGIGPEAESNILRRDTDFFCGDTINFSFEHNADDVTTFHVVTQVTR